MFASFTITQLNRLYGNVWHRMTRGDGYQPWGYDYTTLWAVHPGWMTIIDAIRTEYKSRKKVEIEED